MMAMAGQLMFARRLGPNARLLIWLLVGIACVTLDARYQALEGLRSGFSLMLEPVRQALRAPSDAATEISGFFTRHRLLQKERDALLVDRARLLVGVYAGKDYARENAELRAVLQLPPRPGFRLVHAAQVYQGHDWFSQRITVDQGARAGLRSGLAVVDASGLVGQVSRVYPGTSDVLLVTSSDQLTPVYVERTGQRGLVAGTGRGVLELRYMPAQTDVRAGDRLLTSGIDHVYPPGLPVARVAKVTHAPSTPYLQVESVPLAGIDRSRTVLVLVSEPRVTSP